MSATLGAPVDELTPISEVATELQMSRDTLYRSIRQLGITIYRRLGSRRTFLRNEDVDRLKLGWPRERA